jgi:hypothetical protein
MAGTTSIWHCEQSGSKWRSVFISVRNEHLRWAGNRSHGSGGCICWWYTSRFHGTEYFDWKPKPPPTRAIQPAQVAALYPLYSQALDPAVCHYNIHRLTLLPRHNSALVSLKNPLLRVAELEAKSAILLLLPSAQTMPRCESRRDKS